MKFVRIAGYDVYDACDATLPVAVISADGSLINQSLGLQVWTYRSTLDKLEG